MASYRKIFPCFNRINSGRSIPTSKRKPQVQLYLEGFNRINSGRSIPTRDYWYVSHYQRWGVSIVSIQADQSRPLLEPQLSIHRRGGFNRINSGRSIPTKGPLWSRYRNHHVSIVSIQADQSRLINFRDNKIGCIVVSIVSIQADQSRPGLKRLFRKWILSFNRINSGRSIPTWALIGFDEFAKEVSIVSIQADQSRHLNYIHELQEQKGRFNRINSGRSIPTIIARCLCL